jgi:hypothetical protein
MSRWFLQAFLFTGKVMLTKVCTKCFQEKEVSYFSKSKRGKHGVGATCKQCVSVYYRNNNKTIKARVKKYYEQNHESGLAQRKLYYQQNKEVVLSKQKLYSQRNKETIALKRGQYHKIYYEQNKERITNKNNQWRKSNLDKCNTYSAAYRASKMCATPPWADQDMIADLYKRASKLSCDEIKYHVDHIVPLQSDVVCGLHCEANLQLLLASDNISKSNRWWPDMW